MNAKFNDRDTYLVVAKQWKADYAALTAQIRQARPAARLAESSWAKGGRVSVIPAASGGLHLRSSTEYAAFCKAASEHRSLVATARNAMAERMAMKEEAGRQMRAAWALAGQFSEARITSEV